MRFEESKTHEERLVLILKFGESADGHIGHQAIGQIAVVFGLEFHQVLVAVSIFSMASSSIGKESAPASLPRTEGCCQFIPRVGQFVPTIALSVVCKHTAVRGMRDFADADRSVTAHTK